MNILEFLKTNEKYLEDFITRSTYHSNAIEGSTLTYAETYAILFNDNSITINNKEPREIYEAINHKKALEYLFAELNKETELNDKLVKNINQIINMNIKNSEGYRRTGVLIRGSEEIPPRPEEVNNLMLYFFDDYKNSNEDLFYKLADFHIRFESIHPFEDGNGRTGRILINYELLKNDTAPIVIAKEQRSEYFEYLRNKDTDGLKAFIEKLSKEEKERIEKLRNIK